jgi:hypothetical protein
MKGEKGRKNARLPPARRWALPEVACKLLKGLEVRVGIEPTHKGFAVSGLKLSCSIYWAISLTNSAFWRSIRWILFAVGSAGLGHLKKVRMASRTWKIERLQPLIVTIWNRLPLLFGLDRLHTNWTNGPWN